MSSPRVYNPLDKFNLAKSIEQELLGRPAVPLVDTSGVAGAGVYVIYYTGPFPAYSAIASPAPSDPIARPIYIGKAIPRGSFRGNR